MVYPWSMVLSTSGGVCEVEECPDGGAVHCVVNRAQPGVHSPNTASVFSMELRSGARQRVK